MNDRFSTNGDGKSRAPNDRISVHLDGQQSASPDKQLEQEIHEAEVIEALKGCHDEITALWKEAEEDLKRFHIHHAVEHEYETEDYDGVSYFFVYYLCWMRHGKGWRICHKVRTTYYDDRPDECELKPITDCPLDLRLAMIGEFENLRKKVIAAAEEAVPTLDEAISRFRKILKG